MFICTIIRSIVNGGMNSDGIVQDCMEQTENQLYVILMTPSTRKLLQNVVDAKLVSMPLHLELNTWIWHRLCRFHDILVAR